MLYFFFLKYFGAKNNKKTTKIINKYSIVEFRLVVSKYNISVLDSNYTIVRITINSILHNINYSANINTLINSMKPRI